MPLHVPTRPQSPEKYEVYIGDLAAWLQSRQSQIGCPPKPSVNKTGIIKVRWYWKDMLSSHTQDLSTIIYVTLKRYLHINAKFNYLSTIIYVTLKWYLHINSKFVTYAYYEPNDSKALKNNTCTCAHCIL